jgi:hypothetical protein
MRLVVKNQWDQFPLSLGLTRAAAFIAAPSPQITRPITRYG